MTAGELMGALRRRGVELLADGDRLGVRPAGQLRPEERAALVACKAEVLALLADLAELERDGAVARLRAVAATLSAEEHQRLAQEAASGDYLAGLIMISVLATTAATEAV
jgi:hypothetical protein